MRTSEITVRELANYLRLDYDELSAAEITELNMMLSSAKKFIESYTGLNDYEIEAKEEFSIVVFVLVQDMYDNRVLYVDKSNINKVVDSILGMHSVNLLY